MKKKNVIFIILILLIINLNSIANAKYIFEFEFDVAYLNIDRTKPIIEYIGVTNTNKDYEKYANKTHEIKVNVKVTEHNIGNDRLESNEVKIKIANKDINKKDIKVNLIMKSGNTYIYEIVLNNLTENGLLKIVIEEGAITDLGGLKNAELSINTGISF